MSLPQDGVNANALAEATTIPTGKKLIFLDPDTNEGGIITLENLTKQILSNLATQTFNLDQGTKTLLAALNELNSNRSCGKITTNTSLVITDEKGHGCLLVFYHPYNGNGLYLTCPYLDDKCKIVTPIKELEGIDVSLAGNKITITTSNLGYYYCAVRFPLRNS